MREWIARGLRRLADWLAPRESVALPVVPDAVWNTARALVARAEGFEPGTAGEYRRAWVYGKLVKTHPDVPRRALALVLEVVVNG